MGGMTACNDDDEAVTAPVINTNTVSVTPRVSSLRVGQTQQLAATLLDKNGATVSAGAVTWTSAEPTIATVSATGLVTMLTTGSTALAASRALRDAGACSVVLLVAARAGRPRSETSPAN